MYGLQVEKRKIGAATSLSKDLAQHIFSRYPHGSIVVVADNPIGLMSAVKKQWLRIIRRTARERSSVLGPRRAELNEILAELQSVTFTAKPPFDRLSASVNFASADWWLQAPPMCATLYIVSPVETLERHMLASWMPRNGVVVVYDKR